MFALAFLLGIISYEIFFLGLFHALYPTIFLPLITASLLCFIYLTRNRFYQFIQGIQYAKFSTAGLFVLLLGIQAIINAIGALGPELGFDALWYHLTLPKIFLLHHEIYHIPQTLFYYSDMPKLIEMLYLPLLSTGNIVFPKLLHFFLGLLCCIGLYFFSRKYTSKTIALAAVVIFYSNLVVGWESISGYIDLGRTFFEILALWAFVNWGETDNAFWLSVAASMTGFAVTSKVLALGSMGIFLVLIFLRDFLSKQSWKNICKHLFLFLIITLFIPLPWFIFSFVHTGNPVYPFFSNAYPISPAGSIFNIPHVVSQFWTLFTSAADPISPVYLAFLPLIVISFKRIKHSVKLVYLYSFLALLVWYVAPRTGGGRFILPYLPAFSLLTALSIETVGKKFRFFLIGCVIFVSLISIGYRAAANVKFIPVVTGKETYSKFLATHLNFSFGDFYDTDGFFTSHIKPNDLVFVEGFHNMLYVDFPFTLNEKNKRITYIAIQGNGTLPQKFSSWKEVENNSVTHVRVYHE